VLEGPLELPWFAEALARVVRSTLFGEVAFELHDWRGLDEAACEERRGRLLARDRNPGLDRRASRPERAVLCRRDAATTELIWSFFDRESSPRAVPQLLSHVLATYRALLAEAPTEPMRGAAAWPASEPSSVEAFGLAAYLGQLLGGVEAATPAPGAEPNGRSSTLEGQGRIECALSGELATRIRALAERARVPVAVIVRAAWALLVARFTREEDVVFGVAIAVHPDVGVRSIRNVLPFRSRLTAELRVSDFIATVHALELAARPFAELAPDLVTRELRAAMSSLALESVLVFEPHPLGSLPSALSSPRIRVVSSREEPLAPLTLRVWQHGDDQLAFAFDFERARFRPGMLERVADAFMLVLEELVAGDERPLRELGAVRPAERRKQLERWNATAEPFAATFLFHERFEEQARRHPSAVAVETSSRSVTYAELDAAANRLAHALRARGARPGVRIGICLDRGVELVTALLGVAKSGAAYVPFDPAYPAERLQRIAADAAPALVITGPEYAERFSCELLLADVTDLSAESALAPARLAVPEDDCYVIYTSGSSGNPKGVVLQHRAVVNTCDWVTREFGVGPSDRLLFVTSPCFDLSVYDVFGALGAGATVIVAEQSLLAEPRLLAETLSARRITIWNSAPAVLELVMPFLADVPRDASLRLVLLSGDFIPLALVGELRATFPAARLLSLGGATEAAIWSNYYPVERLEPDWVSVPYGRPLGNCRYYALDSRLEPVPIGTVGELYIGGICLARGYLNQPELTAARFVRDPFSSDPEARLYRTGDLVRYFEDGELEILGRADQQVKIRGFRVELWEVEATLSALSAVAQAVCTTRVDASGQRALVAYVVLHPQRMLTERALKRELAQSLPEFMLPARIVFLEALPLSPNGKLDRKALPVPSEQSEARAVALPITATERAVAEVWQRILGRDHVGRDDDFFALGGHSLLAVSLVAEVRRAFGVELPVTSLLERPTVSALAAGIDQTLAGAATLVSNGVAAVLSFQRGGRAPELFCIGGLGGNPVGIRRLALELGTEQPVHGLYNPSFDARSVRSIEELAAELLTEMRRVQAHGPYYLSGFSAGGVIAFELARMLRTAGEEVRLLVMLDAYNPKLPRWSARERVALFLTMCDEAGLAYAWRRLRARLNFKWELAQLRLLGRRIGDPGDFFGLQAAFIMALSRYVPQAYAGDVLLIRAAPGTASDVDYRTHESNGWRPLVGGRLDVVNLRCRHEDVLRDHVPAVARIMRRALANARGIESTNGAASVE
jgi:amino acid adenylation domain-containing protein